MYGYYDDESRRAGCLKTAQAHRDAAALFPEIRKVFEQFDGKVFNCRLEKALQDATGRKIYVSKSSYNIEVYIYLNDYRGNSCYTLARAKNESLKDGKRIQANEFIQSAREIREKHLQEAAQLETAPDIMPKMVENIKYFISQANKITDAIPYSLQEMYGISKARFY